MRTHGWGGDPPASDDEAMARILGATRACLERDGFEIGIVDVARELGVTRQTVYRYFPSTDDLLQATALDASADLLDAIVARASRLRHDPPSALVEGLVQVLDLMPREPYFRLLLEPGRASMFARSVTTEQSIRTGRGIFERFDLDWRGYDVDERVLNELAELMLRILQSFIVDPGDPPRNKAALRRYLMRWIGPAIAARRVDEHT